MKDKLPRLAGVAEAAEILGWDKRKVATYIKRGVFPDPVQKLSATPIWTVEQIERYKVDIDKGRNK